MTYDFPSLREAGWSVPKPPPTSLIPNIGLHLSEFVLGGIAGAGQNHHGQYVDNDRHATSAIDAKKIHPGIDIAAPEGSTINAFASGKVVAVLTDDGTGRTLGHAIIVELDQKDGDGNTMYALYAHLRDDPTSLSGRHFNRGEEIAKVGNTGFSTDPHLHFELRYFKEWYRTDGWSSATYGKVGSEDTLRTKWIDPSPYIFGYSKPECPVVCTIPPQ
jgi:murein DD-endopeptidase MepM/ murein hydrolase activator NlpD